MTIEEILAEESDWKKRIQIIKTFHVDVSDHINEYNGKRDIRATQVGKRTDRILKSGKQVPVTKTAVAFNRQIVKTAAAMLFGKPVTITPTIEEDAKEEQLQEFLSIWKKIRMDYKLLRACELAKAYTKSALLFKVSGNGRLSCVLLDPAHGDLIPIWDEFDELNSFVYITKVKEADGSEVETVYIWQETGNVIICKQLNDRVDVSEVATGFDRIPVVFFEEEEVEWEEVKPSIDQFEMRLSKQTDTNDYFGNPFFKATGSININPEKDETGVVYEMDIIELDNGSVLTSDLDVVAWDQNVQAVQAELEEQRRLIFDGSFTPDLSFDNVKGIGALSGTALQMMFMQAIIKTTYAWPMYSVGVERCINILKAHLKLLDGVEFDIQHNSLMPENIAETIQTISEAAFNQPIMSQRTAVENNPLVKNKVQEIERLREESQSELGGTVQIPQ